LNRYGNNTKNAARSRRENEMNEGSKKVEAKYTNALIRRIKKLLPPDQDLIACPTGYHVLGETAADFVRDMNNLRELEQLLEDLEGGRE
jgi:hypothetical protein